MTIILDQHPIPDKGTFEIQQTVTLHVSAEEARKTVSRWLFDEVSLNIGAWPPSLVVGERVVWRVPTWIGFSRGGPFELPTIDVDVESGEMLNQEQREAEIIERAQQIAKQLPPFKLRELPEEYHAKDYQPTQPAPDHAEFAPAD